MLSSSIRTSNRSFALTRCAGTTETLLTVMSAGRGTTYRKVVAPLLLLSVRSGVAVDADPRIVTVSPTVPAGSRTVRFRASNSPGPTVRPLVQAHAAAEVSQVQPNCSFSAGSIVLPA